MSLKIMVFVCAGLALSGCIGGNSLSSGLMLGGGLPPGTLAQYQTAVAGPPDHGPFCTDAAKKDALTAAKNGADAAEQKRVTDASYKSCMTALTN